MTGADANLMLFLRLLLLSGSGCSVWQLRLELLAEVAEIILSAVTNHNVRLCIQYIIHKLRLRHQQAQLSQRNRATFHQHERQLLSDNENSKTRYEECRCPAFLRPTKLMLDTILLIGTDSSSWYLVRQRLLTAGDVDCVFKCLSQYKIVPFS